MPVNLKKCLKMQERAKRRMPGMTQLLSKRPDQFSYGVWPGYYSKAKGVEVWDLDDNRYIDMSIGGIGANVLGYADPDVDAAVIQAVCNGTSCSLNCPEEVELADLLCELHPWADMVRYARTGGEAMAVAVRIARAKTGRDKIAFCGYHGWHDWYLAANLQTDALGDHLLPGLDPTGVPKALAGTILPFGYNDVEAFKKIAMEHGNSLATIVMESIRGSQPHPDFFPIVMETAKKHGIVLVIDEISAGFRMNTGGAHLLLGIEPDVAVFSKALGNGYPIAAIIGKGNTMDAAQKTFISSTAWTERIGPTAALATIRKHRDVDAGRHLITMGEMIREGWRSLSKKHSLDLTIGGIKPISYFVFQEKNPLAIKAYFIQLMIERGFLASNLFYAMYAHTEEHVRSYLVAADNAFEHIATALSRDDLETKLRGRPSSAGFKRIA